MPAAGFPWTPCSPSRERRRWLLAAAAACGLLALMLCLPLLGDSGRPTLWASAAASAGGALWALRSARRPPSPLELRIDADGTPWLRSPPAADGEMRALRTRPLHVSSRLISLASPLGVQVIWPDSLPDIRFRQLAAYARWHIERAAGERRAGAGRPAEEARVPPAPTG